MKNKIITVAIFIILLSTEVFASSGTVEFKSNTTEVKKGETFTITISAKSEDGINGIDTQYSYDSNKLELVNEKVVDSSNWSNMGASPDITLICNSTQSVKKADLYILTFKVKDDVSNGESLKIETTGILLDTDAQNDSEVNIPSKKVEIVVKDKSGDNINENDNKTNESEDKENNEKTQNENDNKTNELKNKEDSEENLSQNDEQSNASEKKESNISESKINTTRSDSTVKKGTLPKTGENFIMIAMLIVIAIVVSMIFYKKYVQHKDII